MWWSKLKFASVTGRMLKEKMSSKRIRRRLIKERGSRCEECGLEFEDSELTVHHIIPRLLRPDLKSVDKNAMLLCKLCHRAMHYGSRDMSSEDMVFFLSGIGWPSGKVKKKKKKKKKKQPELSAPKMTYLNIFPAHEAFSRLLRRINNAWEKGKRLECKRKVLERDGFQCVSCGKTGNFDTLNVFRIRTKSQGGDRYDPDNGETICYSCHYEKHRIKNSARE